MNTMRTRVVIFILAIAAGFVLLNTTGIAQSSRPYAVFVNGQGNCCAYGMNDLQKRLIEFGAEIRYVPYSNFNDGGESKFTNDDSSFLRDGAIFINDQLDKNRPLILIGHSYGGDSILKLLPRIKRRIQFVGVLDPVGTGGWRAPLKKHTVPDTVDYFYNRWQDNEIFPTDFRSDGSIPCLAKTCNQYKQPFVTNADGEVHREKCALLEPCSYKNRRLGHQAMPRDEWIQRIMGDRIKDTLTAKAASEGVFAEGALVRNSKGTVWRIERGRKRGILHGTIFELNGYDLKVVQNLPDSVIDRIPDGPVVTIRDGALIRNSKGTIWLMEGERKRGIISGAVFDVNRFDPKAVRNLPDYIIDSIPDGPLISGKIR